MYFLQDDFDYEIKSPPMMVPMADALNHIAKNNAKLKFGKESLKMVACQSIRKVSACFRFLDACCRLYFKRTDLRQFFGCLPNTNYFLDFNRVMKYTIPMGN